MEEEETWCDGAIYADPGRRSRSDSVSTQGEDYLRGMHIEWGFLSGGLQLGGVISGGLISRGLSPAFGLNGDGKNPREYSVGGENLFYHTTVCCPRRIFSRYTHTHTHTLSLSLSLSLSHTHTHTHTHTHWHRGWDASIASLSEINTILQSRWSESAKLLSRHL